MGASCKMASQRCSSILVMEGDEVIGIWTEKDALKHDFSSADNGLVAISKLMSSPVKAIPASMPLEEVSSEFRKDGFRHYLVQDDSGRRLGIISQTDVVLKYSLEYYLVPRSVGSVVHAMSPFLPCDAPLAEAIRLMREHRVDALLVDLSSGRQGIITERDIIKAIAAGKDDPRVADYATQGLVTIEENASLFQAKQHMLEKRIRHIGVVDKDHRVFSIINLENILDGMLNSYLEELRDVVIEQKRELEESMAHLHLAQKVITSTLEGIVVTDADGIIQSCNPAFTEITGYQEREVLGKPAALLASRRHDKAFYASMRKTIREKGYWKGEIWNRKKSGQLYLQQLTISAIRDEKTGRTSHYACMFSDITEAKQDEEMIRHLAFHDPLTGLTNRRLLMDRLERAIVFSVRSKHLFALLFLDLDRFKPINDDFGHLAGDFLLQKMADRLREELRETDTIARVGGDEFVVILTSLGSDRESALGQIRAIAEKIQTRLSAPCSFEGRQLSVSCSMGAVLYPGCVIDAGELLKQADSAMYRAKAAGGGRVCFFEEEKKEPCA